MPSRSWLERVSRKLFPDQRVRRQGPIYRHLEVEVLEDRCIPCTGCFVQSLYNDFLGRVGSAAEVNGWVNEIPVLGYTGVANGIIRSPEGLTHAVDAFYGVLLGRQPIGGEDMGWVNQLESAATEEQVLAGILASPEFANRANGLIGGGIPNTNYVQELYRLLLGRTGSTAEVNGWVNVLPSLGRDPVALGFLSSQEFRTDVVQELYGFALAPAGTLASVFPPLLGRSAAPAAAEINSWVFSGQDIATMEGDFASSNEYVQSFGLDVQGDPSSGTSDVWNFVTAPRLHPMKVSVLQQQPGTAPGLVFTGPYGFSPNSSDLVGQDGALIMDNAGNPIWFLPVSSTNQTQVLDFRAQTYFGQPVLTWWQGTAAGSVPSDLPDGTALPGAKYFVYNDHYQQVFSISAVNGFTSDDHEFLLTSQGYALFTAVKQVFMDLTPYGGEKNGSFVDSAIQEIDPRTGRLIFSWDMLDHIPLSDSIVPAPTSGSTAWDPYHMNSLDVGPNGQLLLSVRNTWGVYAISNPAIQGGGQILWQLGGKPQMQWPQFSISNDITGPYNTAFQWQHDAQYQPDTPPGVTELSLFDDACCDSPYPAPFTQGQGLIMNLDFNNLTASVLKSYPHDPPLFPRSQGDVQALSNGDEFIGWGAESYYSEYTQGGTVLYDVLMPGFNVSYRTFRNTWVGLPVTTPAIAVQPVNGQPVVYASWNGSTETVAWRLLAGRSPNALLPVSITARTGFETAIPTTDLGPCYAVQALDANGQVLQTSNVISTLRMTRL